MTVSLVERLAAPEPPAILCTRYDFDLEDHPGSSYGRTVLMDAPGNAVVLVAKLGLLGAVMERESLTWHSGGPVRLDRAVMARRDIAASMNAVGDSVYALDEYCYLRRDDWISVPQVLNHHLCGDRPQRRYLSCSLTRLALRRSSPSHGRASSQRRNLDREPTRGPLASTCARKTRLINSLPTSTGSEAS